MVCRGKFGREGKTGCSAGVAPNRKKVEMGWICLSNWRDTAFKQFLLWSKGKSKDQGTRYGIVETWIDGFFGMGGISRRGTGGQENLEKGRVEILEYREKENIRKTKRNKE
jgi:hypothetical protein